MDGIQIPLRPVDIVNLNPKTKTGVDVVFLNSSGKIHVNDSPNDELIFFSVENLEDLGLRPDFDWSINQLSFIMAVSVSLLSELIVFTPKEYSEKITPKLKKKAPNSEETYDPMIETVDGDVTVIQSSIPSVTLSVEVAEIKINTTVMLDEIKLLSVFKYILNLILMGPVNRNKSEENVIDALNDYFTAISNDQRRQVFEYLFRALEKNVNAQKDTSGPRFDFKASQMTSMNESDIFRLRSCYNRLKHVDDDENKRKMFQECYQKITELVKCAKKATDQAFLRRI